MTNFLNLAIAETTVEPLDIDEVMANLFIDLDLNDTADDDLISVDLISVPGLVDDIGYLGDCEDIINNWTDLQSAPNYVRTDLQSAPNYVRTDLQSAPNYVRTCGE